MNNIERFLSVAFRQKPDYIPIFGFPGAPGMSRGCQKQTHRRLFNTGMPSSVTKGSKNDIANWHRYWGTTGPETLDFSVASGAKGIKKKRRMEGGYVIIEGEDGSITREVPDNADTYSMPEFRVYPVRDRASWEFYKDRTAPRKFMDKEETEQNCRRFDKRELPLVINAGSTFGKVRGLMGTVAASLALYDEPELVHEIISIEIEHNRRHVFPLIERLRPEIVACWEDIGFKTSMLISPAKFREFCAPLYREVSECANACGVTVLTVDSDGNAMELIPLLVECGFNSLYPFEAAAGNNLFELQKLFPRLVMFGWLDKDVVNEGREKMIEPEIMGKVPALIEKGGYFPNGDHGIQPAVTYPNLRKFMTILHEICNNPEGDFQRA